MPTSDYTSIPAVMDALGMLQPKSICDIGVGCGKYGLLIRETYDLQHRSGTEWEGTLFQRTLRLDGVEVFPNYIEALQRSIYDRIMIGDIVALADDMEEYDLFTMFDVIEHIDHESGISCLEKLRRKARIGILLVTPIKPGPQGVVSGNVHESHVSTWGPKEWDQLGRTRYMTICGRKWLTLVEGRESGLAPWLRKPRLRRRLKLAVLGALNGLLPGRVDLPALM